MICIPDEAIIQVTALITFAVAVNILYYYKMGRLMFD